jgi:hypothetical protein
MKKTLLIADLHLTTHPLDYYKWNIFEKLMEEITLQGIKIVNILGDLTEKKDNHSALLVNKLCSYLEVLLSSGVEQIRILKGNHDFVNEEIPFFEFLNVSPQIQFITTPTRIDNEFFYPYTTEYDLPKYADEINKCEYLYMHTQLKGIKLDNGKVLEEGLTKEDFSCIKVKDIFSGHLHYFSGHLENRPVRYLGSPYPVYFGDGCNYGSIVILPSNFHWNYVEAIARYNESFKTLENFEEWLEIATIAKDQLKVTFELDRTDYDKWPDMKKEVKELCKNRKLELISLTLKPTKSTVLLSDNATNEPILLESYIETAQRFAGKEKLSPEYLTIAEGIINANT